jgi:type VI secretion system secreted protein VgrG
MSRYTQANRPLRIDTALGEDVLLLSAVRGVEAISRPFSFELELLSVQPDIDPAAILRTGVLITLRLADGERRHVHGIVNRFAQLGRQDDIVHYRAEVVPRLWFLSLSRESRIYQELTVPDIVEQVLRRTGLTEFEFRLTRDYPERLFSVQYRETHLDFLSRLLEEEGIRYFFEHAEDQHLLVIADDNGTSRPVPGAATLRCTAEGRNDECVVTELTREHSVHPGRVTLWDYDYLKPTVRLAATLGEELEEVYDYPGLYRELDDGERLARLQLEAAEAERQIVRGVSDAAGLTPGHDVSLRDHYRADFNGKYLVTNVRHQAQAGEYRAWDQSAPLTYRNEFLAVPVDTPYRPPRQTPRPSIRGAQTALVVGPPGEEVYVDNHGRIKVQFHWDRDGRRDENSSCWVRVATPWGGKGYGSVSVPRIGNEVIVGFEEGDPDRPVVLGSLYNADQTPPYPLPGAGIQMGMQSRSSPGGGGRNEITMTDTKGKEKVNIHAQYDMATTVENDQTLQVGNNRSAVVGVDDSLEVGANRKTTVGADRSTTVGANEELMVGADRTVAVGGNEATRVGGDRTVAVGGNDDTSVGGSHATTASSDIALTSGASTEIIAGAGMKLGAATIEVTANGTIEISAPGGITLVAGGSKVELTPGSITISAPGMVDIKAAMVKNNA